MPQLEQTMAFSCTDFTDNILNHLIQLGVIREDDYDPEDPESQANAAIAAINKLSAPREVLLSPGSPPTGAAFGKNGEVNSTCFMQELLASHETLTGIGDIHGVYTLADCMYMLSALQRGTYIEVHRPSDSKILEVIQSLPSAKVWMTHVNEIDA